MDLILGGINGEYLRNITENHHSDTEEVLAAVAYASDSSLLFEWCLQYNIPLKFYGRLDDSVAVSTSVLSMFLNRRSANFVCYLVQHHHAKVIWWRGVGVYIGSANLTGNAWYNNIEAGCFFPETEITNNMANDLNALFITLKENATPLTDELLKEMQQREKRLSSIKPDADNFWKNPSFTTWNGLVQTTRKSADDRKRETFLKEWHSTLQILRDIGTKVSMPENRPSWVSDSAPAGAQADQFLNAHYYKRTFDGTKALYEDYFERNKHNPDAALADAINWWHNLPLEQSSEESIMLNSTAPKLRKALSAKAINSMNYETFREICMGIHSIKDYARRVANKTVGLLEDGTKYTIPEKVAALSKKIWNDRSAGGKDVKQLLSFILYGGPETQLPERLWSAIHEQEWKIEGLGVSALGELVGWALPDRFPPRNGRTSKALRSLGFDVTVHVG